MNELAPRYYPSGSPVSPASRFGGQPVFIGIAAFAVIVLGIGGIAGWRAYSGTSPELDRVVASRQLQARATQASEQLVEKTKGIEATQQELIDQLQVVQDQSQTVRRLLAAQQTDTKKLSEQVTTLTESIDGLRQSFASARSRPHAVGPQAGPEAQGGAQRQPQARQVAGLTSCRPRSAKPALAAGFFVPSKDSRAFVNCFTFARGIRGQAAGHRMAYASWWL